MWFTRDGKFIKEFGRHGRKPGEFMESMHLRSIHKALFRCGPSNNRVQIFDKNMNFVDEWRHFGRPSGIWILKDDTLIVSDSESNNRIGGPPDAPEGGGNAIRNPGWRTGIRLGSARQLAQVNFIEGTQPEGLAGDEAGNVFGGLTGGGCDQSKSGNLFQKFVKEVGHAGMYWGVPSAKRPDACRSNDAYIERCNRSARGIGRPTLRNQITKVANHAYPHPQRHGPHSDESVRRFVMIPGPRPDRAEPI